MKQLVSALGKHLSASMYSQKFSEQEDSQGGGITKIVIDSVDWKVDWPGVLPITMSFCSGTV